MNITIIGSGIPDKYLQIKMPLGKNVKKNIKELIADNKKSGKAKGANGKKRPMKQIVAIAYSASKKK